MLHTTHHTPASDNTLADAALAQTLEATLLNKGTEASKPAGRPNIQPRIL